MAQSYEATMIVDTAAGGSYLLLANDQFKQIPRTPLKSPVHVCFADGSKQTLHHSVIGALTIQDVEGETHVTHPVRLLVLSCPTQRAGTVEILLGRDLIKKFDLVIHDTTKVTSGKTTLYERLASNKATMDHVRRIIDLDRLADELCLIDTDDDKEYPTLTNSSDPRQPDDGALDISFYEDTSAPMGRAHVRIPWKDGTRPPLNFTITKARDRAVGRRLSTHERTLYEEAIAQLLNGNFALPLDNSDLTASHYISVRPVFKTDRATTKCRLCLDARDINLLTRTGPRPTKTILDCLLSFRSTEVVCTFDLVKAFWQIKYHDEDVGWYATRVLDQNIVFTSMIFGSNFSPAALDQTLEIILRKSELELKVRLCTLSLGEPPRPTSPKPCHHYVDDFHSGGEDARDLRRYVTWIRWYLEQHGFPSSKCFMNSEDAVDSWTPFLGYEWNPQSDTVRTRLYQLDPPTPLTLRQLVGIVATFYDPLGAFLHLQLYGRNLVREGFASLRSTGRTAGTYWDLELSHETRERVDLWTQTINTARLTFTRRLDFTRLYVFTDASTQCWVYEVRDANLRMVFSRGGLTAPKSTIPKNELHALALACKDLTRWNLEQLHTTTISFHTDSACTIQRLLRKADKLGLFETRRLETIRNAIETISSPSRDANRREAYVSYIWGTHNPADYATRPLLETRAPLDTSALQILLNSPTGTFLKYPGPTEDDTIRRMQLRSAKKQPAIRAPQALPTPTDDAPHRDANPAEDDDNPEEDPVGALDAPHPAPPDDSAAKISKIRNSQVRHDTKGTHIDEHQLQRDSNDLVILPDADHDLFADIFHRLHDDTHPGIQATCQRFKTHRYTLKNLRTKVTRMIHACHVCQKSRAHRHLATAVGRHLDTDPFTNSFADIGIGNVIGLDIATIQPPSHSTSGFTCILTLTCAISKWIRTSPLPTQLSADVITALASCLHTSFYPRVIVTDNGPCFRSRKFALFCLEQKIAHVTLPPYSSTYAGWFERSHGSVLTALRVLTAKRPQLEWIQLLPEATYIANTRPYDLNTADSLCPLDIVFAGYPHKNLDLADPVENEELLRLAHLAHLTPPHQETLATLKQRAIAGRRRTLNMYVHIWHKKQVEIQSKLLRARTTLKTSTLPIGSSCRVFRPVISKAQIPWSEPHEVINIPSLTTRTVRATDGTTLTEHILNLLPIPP